MQILTFAFTYFAKAIKTVELKGAKVVTHGQDAGTDGGLEGSVFQITIDKGFNVSYLQLS